jgi:GNAT superfamily N-acetyltransferase
LPFSFGAITERRILITKAIKWEKDFDRALTLARADDLQGNGLGSILLIRVIKVGREHGYSRFGAQQSE